MSRRTAERAAARATLLRAAAATTERLTAAWRAALDTPNEVGAGQRGGLMVSHTGVIPGAPVRWAIRAYCGVTID